MTFLNKLYSKITTCLLLTKIDLSSYKNSQLICDQWSQGCVFNTLVLIDTGLAHPRNTWKINSFFWINESINQVFLEHKWLYFFTTKGVGPNPTVDNVRFKDKFLLNPSLTSFSFLINFKFSSFSSPNWTWILINWLEKLRALA